MRVKAVLLYRVFYEYYRDFAFFKYGRCYYGYGLLFLDFISVVKNNTPGGWRFYMQAKKPTQN